MGAGMGASRSNQNSLQQQDLSTAQDQYQNGSTVQGQNSFQNPWAAAMPAISGILGQLQGNIGNAGLTGRESGALDQLTSNASSASQYLPQLQSLVGDLFNGGGATTQSGNISQNLADYQRRLGSTADGQNIGMNSGLMPYLDTIRTDVSNQVNGMFAGAGRDLSGANLQALGRGIAQGQAPVIAQQYNQDVANQRSAADALYGGGNTTAGLLSGLQQQALSNRQAGAGLAPSVFDTQNAGANAVLQAEAARRGIPVQALGLLANIGIPLAGLGGTSGTTGTSTTANTANLRGNTHGTGFTQQSGTQTASPLTQFGQLAGGLNSLFGGGSSTAGNIFGGAGRALSFFGL